MAYSVYKGEVGTGGLRQIDKDQVVSEFRERGRGDHVRLDGRQLFYRGEQVTVQMEIG